MSPPGPPHLGLLEEGTKGSVVRLEGWGPLASGASPWLNWSGRESLSPEVVLGTWLQRPPTIRWGLPGSAPGLWLLFSGTRGKRKSPIEPKLPLLGLVPLAPTAPTPFPSSSSLCTLASGAGGRGGGWSFTFFPLFSLLQETASDDAGGLHRSPPGGSRQLCSGVPGEVGQEV